MGFYIELAPVGPKRFQEGIIPPIFWILYAIAGFALLCMGGAAHAVLGDLLEIGSTFDQVILSLIFAAVPLYFLIGLKLLLVRKFVAFEGNHFKMGYLFAKKPVLVKKFSPQDVEDILLLNRKPSPNVAVRLHEDSQYHLQGHWRVILKTGKKFLTIDKHTDKGALQPLYKDLLDWKNGEKP